MLQGDFEYRIKRDKDRHKSRYEINEKMKLLNKQFSATIKALLHSHQEIDKHKRVL